MGRPTRRKGLSTGGKRPPSACFDSRSLQALTARPHLGIGSNDVYLEKQKHGKQGCRKEKKEEEKKKTREEQEKKKKQKEE